MGMRCALFGQFLYLSGLICNISFIRSYRPGIYHHQHHQHHMHPNAVAFILCSVVIGPSSRQRRYKWPHLLIHLPSRAGALANANSIRECAPIRVCTLHFILKGVGCVCCSSIVLVETPKHTHTHTHTLCVFLSMVSLINSLQTRQGQWSSGEGERKSARSRAVITNLLNQAYLAY